MIDADDFAQQFGAVVLQTKKSADHQSPALDATWF
jgi:hypothetical protein